MASGYLHRRSTPARIVDVLETTGEVMTAESLTAELRIRFDPHLEADMVRQASKRLVLKGRIVFEWSDEDAHGQRARLYRFP